MKGRVQVMEDKIWSADTFISNCDVELKTVTGARPLTIPTAYKLDWDKVKSIDDLILIMKLMTSAHDRPTHLVLYDEQVDAHKHLLKD